ncbi:MAG: hypothetical protein HY424_01020 [Candidatus Levybacteria bacterium]|nr:hypothetical protein [Candidatus Levybacteria bacterium]
MKIENLKLKIPILVGLATFFFGFGAGAILNIYLITIKSPLVLNFRSSLNFISSIVGDGIILPIVNMLIVTFIIKNLSLISKINVVLGVAFGLLITLYFYITQAVQGLVNWSMPTPWHWNFLGVWHFFYMLSVTSLISFYVLLLVKKIKKEKTFPSSAFFIIGGITLFLILLKLDYSNIDLLR